MMTSEHTPDATGREAKQKHHAYARLSGFRVRAGALRLRERAEEIGVSVKTLRRAIGAGELACVRLAGKIYVNDLALADWLSRKESRRTA